MKKIYIYMLVAAIFAVWLYVIIHIDGSITLEGILMSAFMSAATFVLIGAIFEVVRRVRSNQPLVEERPPQPRKLPLWYRVLSKIF